MLQNDFYTVQEPSGEAGTFSCKLRFRADHDIFSGHFPGQPVVPGVCMMQIVRELVAERTGRDWSLSAAPQVKFLQLIVPGTEPEVSLSWSAAEGGLKVQAVFTSGASALFKMSAFFS